MSFDPRWIVLTPGAERRGALVVPPDTHRGRIMTPAILALIQVLAPMVLPFILPPLIKALQDLLEAPKEAQQQILVDVVEGVQRALQGLPTAEPQDIVHQMTDALAEAAGRRGAVHGR
jgi:hypothetical protein